MELVLAKSQDALVLTSISKRAFNSDIEVGGTQVGGPPGYQSQKFYAKMAAQKHLYTLYNNGLIVGGAVLFRDGTNLYIGRIFIDPEYFHEGLGIKLMEMIENLYSDVISFTLDTPLWNIRTNNFYQKLGYEIEKKDKEFAYYIKKKVLYGAKNQKVVVFDLGGTLMQYVGMPHSWVDYYYKGFEAIIQKYRYHISQEVIEKSIQMLKEFNPRINYREIEYSAEYIFTKVLEPWHMDISVQSCLETFWSGLQLKAEIYPETIHVLQKLREKGYAIATLTDLPSAMPDEIFRRDISKLLNYFDYYVSSSVAGYRKPNCKGLQMISEKFATPMTELIFVGDEEKDRKTAINANCKFIWIQRTEKNRESICNLYELLEVLE